MSWILNLRSRDDVLALTRRHGDGTVSIHKYAVVEDRRSGRISEWGTGETISDLSKVTVSHDVSLWMHNGCVVDRQHEPVPAASRQLAQKGIEVVLQ